jgi:hypothetical protein
MSNAGCAWGIGQCNRGASAFSPCRLPRASTALISRRRILLRSPLFKDRLALADFDADALKDPDVLKLSSKIRLEDDANSGSPKYASGHVFVKTNDGKVYEERQHIHPGHIENPVSAADVQEKYLYNALRLVSQEKAKSLMRQVMSIERLSNLLRADPGAALLETALSLHSRKCFDEPIFFLSRWKAST